MVVWRPGTVGGMILRVCGGTMRCSGCGEKGSLGGEICAACGREKANDRKKLMIITGSTVGGGLIGLAVGGSLQALVGLFLGWAGGQLVGLTRYGSEEYLRKQK
jgi:hypothetical protein